MRKTAVFYFLLLCFLAGCQTQNTTNGYNLLVDLQETDPQKTIEVALEGEFTLTLAANPTTGYEWRTTEATNPLLELVQTSFVFRDPDVDGSGGWVVWRFKAITTGETQLTLALHPPSGSDTETEPVETRTFTIIVR